MATSVQIVFIICITLIIITIAGNRKEWEIAK